MPCSRQIVRRYNGGGDLWEPNDRIIVSGGEGVTTAAVEWASHGPSARARALLTRSDHEYNYYSSVVHGPRSGGLQYNIHYTRDVPA